MFTASVNEYSANTLGTTLIIAGPHGAGKDTLAEEVSRHLDVARVVRHITRPATSNEVNGVDYHFINDTAFECMVAKSSFIEHAAYIGSKSGTSSAELTSRLGQADYAGLTANFEDGLKLHRLLGNVGLRSVCFFVSPCSEEEIQGTPDQYLATLHERMMSRGRATDLIQGRLSKAALYRELYLDNAGEATYVDNSDGRITQASGCIVRTALARATSPLLSES